MSNQISENRITYRKVGDYLIPNITLPADEREITLGKWGLKHKDYLMKNKQVLFNIMLTKGTLMHYISEIDKQAEDMFSQLVNDFAEDEGITEQLKADNQIEWVHRMNNIRNRAEEVVDNEIIYR